MRLGAFYLRRTLVGHAMSAVWLACVGASAAASEVCPEGHFHLGDNPIWASAEWSREAQGLAHDESHWLISNRTTLFRVAVASDLEDLPAVGAPPGAQRVDIPERLSAEGFDHFGDLAWVRTPHGGFLCVPVERASGRPAIAFFRSHDLHYLGAAELPGLERAPTCALDAGSHVVVGRTRSAAQPRYRVDWERVAAGDVPALEPVAPLVLVDEAGAGFRFEHLGGAGFSADGSRLYLATGFYDDHACPLWSPAFWTGGCPGPEDPEVGGGLRVFRVADPAGNPCASAGPCRATLVERSVNRGSDDGDRGFAYRYRATLLRAEEPEGLTVWDLDAPGTPHAHATHGQVHALVLANGLFDALDRASIKHYRLERHCPPLSGVAEEPR